LVRDIASGSADSFPRDFTAVGSTIFFTAESPATGRELWKTDGTAAGTVLVADISAGSGSSQPGYLTALGNTLLFSAETTVVTPQPGNKKKGATTTANLGRELWKSDGTAAGTVLVKDIYTGFNGSNPAHLLANAGVVYFTAYQGEIGEELWRTDGTAAGTFLLRDFTSGLMGSFPRNLTPFNGAVYFNANQQIWRTDGSLAGTVLVDTLVPLSTASIGPKVGNLLSLIVEDTSGMHLWTTDGTPAGTRSVYQMLPSNDANLVELGIGFGTSILGADGLLFFTSFTNERGTELNSTDGVNVVTNLLTGLPQSANNFFLPAMLIVGGNSRVFLAANHGSSSWEFWASAGTPATTHLAKDLLAD
jgi:ELWxxDGT repeat protein